MTQSPWTVLRNCAATALVIACIVSVAWEPSVGCCQDNASAKPSVAVVFGGALPGWARVAEVSVSSAPKADAVVHQDVEALVLRVDKYSDDRWKDWVRAAPSLIRLTIQGECELSLAALVEVCTGCALRELELRNVTLLDDAVAGDKDSLDFDELRVLDVSCTPRTLLTLVHLGNPSSLTVGSAVARPVKGILPSHLSEICRLPRLTSLTVSMCDELLSERSLAAADLTRLKHLRVDAASGYLTSPAEKRIPELVQLESLEVRAVRVDFVHKLKGFDKLRSLSLESVSGLTARHFVSIGSLKQLRSLTITGGKLTLDALAALHGLTQLQSVTFQMGFEDGATAGLSDWTSTGTLKKLRLIGMVDISPEFAGWLGQNEVLVELELSFFKPVSSTQVSEAVGRCSKVAHLSLHNVSLNQELADATVALPLSSLELGVSDEAFKTVQVPASWSKVTKFRLDLMDSSFGRGFSWSQFLKRLANVEHLEVSGWELHAIARELIATEQLKSLSLGSFTREDESALKTGHEKREAPLQLLVLGNDADRLYRKEVVQALNEWNIWPVLTENAVLQADR